MAGRPCPPASAYQVMAYLLPHTYFTSPPPVTGIELEVTAGDGAPTKWRMDAALATRVQAQLAGRCRVVALPYSDRNFR